MENQTNASAQPSETLSQQPPAAKKKFGLISALVRIVVAFAIVGGGVMVFSNMMESRPEPVERRNFERSFTVAVQSAERLNFTPTISSFGQIEAANTIQFRAQAPGEIINVSDDLRPGARVQSGTVLVQIDPFDYQLALSNAQVDLADARLAHADAQEQLKLQQINVDFAREQLTVAQSDLTRAQTLIDRGTITNQELDSRVLVVSQREQSLRQAESTLTLQEAGLSRSSAAIQRALRAVQQAERTLASTYLISGFDGIVTQSSATLGAVVSQNEALVTLYEAANLEVRFSLSELQFGRFARDELLGREVLITWDISDAPRTVSGSITRIGAEVNAALGSIELYAMLDLAGDDAIRPGTFVSVALPGPSFEDVFVLPETAIYENEYFFIVKDGRMSRVEATLLSRSGSDVVVNADIDDGTPIVTSRLAQAGEGVKVLIEGEQDQAPEEPRGSQEIEGVQEPSDGAGE